MKNFVTYQVALQATRQLAGCLVVIKRKDRDLDRQLRRAMQSVVLNLAEGNRRRGQDRLHLFRIAAGSAAEVQAGLDVAEAWGYLGADMVAPVRGQLDSVLGLLYRLTEGKKKIAGGNRTRSGLGLGLGLGRGLPHSLTPSLPHSLTPSHLPCYRQNTLNDPKGSDGKMALFTE